MEDTAYNRHNEIRSSRQHVRLKGAIAACLMAVAGAVLVTGSAPDGLENVARLALVAPAAIYVLWWMTTPGFAGITGDTRGAVEHSGVDLEQVRETFDHPESYALIRATSSGDARAEYQATLRRPQSAVPADFRPRFREDGAEPESASGGS